MDKRPIGIFDSGIGGLTVLAQIEKLLPKENIVYIGDTKNFPYGEKTKEEIIEFSIKNVEKLIEKNAKIIVIACGTATSQSLEVLKEKFEIPIIGIIEPTVEEIKKKNIEKIGVIATEGTIRSNAWEKALKKDIEKIEVVNKACPLLANIAEEGKAKSQESRQAIKEYMKPFKANNVKTIILGCTHYPIYEEIIQEEMERKVELINTGNAVAKFVKQYLENNNLQNIEEDNVKQEIYLSKDEETFKENAEKILERKIITKKII